MYRIHFLIDYMPTILITGCSSGIGKTTALLFAKKGWNVIATMRKPELVSDFDKISNIHVTKLDVTEQDQIKGVILEGIHKFGEINVLVNNAGYGLTGPFEGTSEAQIVKLFNTNLFGAMHLCKAILPHFRDKKSGTIINVTSMGGKITLPYYSLYNSTKWALEGFSEALAYEVQQFGIKIKIIEPGQIKTDFYDRSMDESLGSKFEEYANHFQKINHSYNSFLKYGSSPHLVSESIWRAATDKSNQIRYVVGWDARLYILLRKILPERLAIWIMGKAIGV